MHHRVVQKRLDDPTAGVVDQNVETPEIIHRRLDHAACDVFPGQVAGFHDWPPGAARGDVIRNGAEASLVDIRKHELGSGVGEMAGDDCANAAGSAGHHD